MTSITQVGALRRDDDDSPVMGGTSSSDNLTIINSAFDPVTRRLLTTYGGGSGTVTTVSVATANGFSGTVANATTTPAITIIAGAITPTSVNSVVISGSSTPTLAVTGTTAVSGSNTRVTKHLQLLEQLLQLLLFQEATRQPSLAQVELH